MTPKWSILVASIPTRYPSPAGDLWAELWRQTMGVIHRPDTPPGVPSVGTRKVELIGLIDNFQRSVGEKRNMLLDMARGEYVSFLDDDDLVFSDFVPKILGQIQKTDSPDVIHWWQKTLHIQTGLTELCEYGLDYEYGTHPLCDDFRLWRGRPAHTMVWRAEIAKACRFPEKDCGEDVDWVKQACALAKTEVRIPKVLTQYNFDSAKSETRGDGWREKWLKSQ